MPILVLLFLFVMGLCAGSFVNVVVLRFGFDERAPERSHCMACNAQLAWYDLLPVISFFILRARCINCGSALSRQYPLVELSVALSFLGSGIFVPPMLSFFSLLAFGALLFFLAALTALVAYDIRHTLVPMPFVYALLGSALVASISQSIFSSSWVPLYDSAIGGGLLFIFFMLIVLITKGKGMGAGDAYVVGAIGILFGFMRGTEVVMTGVWAGTIIGLLMLVFKKRTTLKTELPLIPFLAFGTIVGLFTNFSPLQLASNFSNALFFGHS